MVRTCCRHQGGIDLRDHFVVVVGAQVVAARLIEGQLGLVEVFFHD